MEFKMLNRILLSSVVTLGLVSAASAGGVERSNRVVAAPAPVQNVRTAPPVQAAPKAATSKASPLCGSLGGTLSHVDADFKGPETSVDDKNYGFGLLCVTTGLLGFSSEVEVAYTKWIDESEAYNLMGSPREQATKVTSTEITLKAFQPITNKLSFYVKGGFVRGDIRQRNFLVGMLDSTIKESDTAPILGLGLDYKVMEKTSLRLEHNDMSFKKNSRKADIDGLKFTLVRMFN
jgi:opacity protein-like surface antigen